MSKWNEGDCFETGQVWESPRGFLYKVVGHRHYPQDKRRQAELRAGSDGSGRLMRRDWDAVAGWFIHRPESNPPTPE